MQKSTETTEAEIHQEGFFLLFFFEVVVGVGGREEVALQFLPFQLFLRISLTRKQVCSAQL